jgi:hypothetical protein
VSVLEIFVKVVVHVETSDHHFKIVKSLLKFFLLNLHTFKHLLFKFIKNFVLCLNDLLNVFGGFEEFPLMSKFNTSKFNIEFVENPVNFHALIDFAFKLFYLNTDFTDKLFSVSKFIDIFRNFVDFCCDFIEFGLNLVGFIFSLLLDQLDFFVNNLLVFSSIEISNVFAVDLEHANNYRFRNQLFQLLFLLQIFIDVLAKFFW